MIYLFGAWIALSLPAALSSARFCAGVTVSNSLQGGSSTARYHGDAIQTRRRGRGSPRPAAGPSFPGGGVPPSRAIGRALPGLRRRPSQPPAAMPGLFGRGQFPFRAVDGGGAGYLRAKWPDPDNAKEDIARALGRSVQSCRHSRSRCTSIGRAGDRNSGPW